MKKMYQHPQVLVFETEIDVLTGSGLVGDTLIPDEEIIGFEANS